MLRNRAEKAAIMSVTKGPAERILAPVNPERAFYFYVDIGMPIDVVANSLKDFGEKLKTVETKSLEFHLGRGDFERWVYMLGDSELAKSMVKLRETGFAGPKLRSELVRNVQTRVRQLQRSVAR
jgi:hypothetical protein